MINNYKKEYKEKGFSLFIAMIVMGGLLLAAFAISNLAAKESIFANSNRESQYAFFAADAGIECALYWDSKSDAFATTSGNTTTSVSCNASPSISTNSQNPISGSISTVSRIGGGSDTNATSTFGFSLSSTQNTVNSCVIVTVNKSYVGSSLVTDVYSRGYNNCNTLDSRRVERGIEVKY